MLEAAQMSLQFIKGKKRKDVNELVIEALSKVSQYNI